MHWSVVPITDMDIGSLLEIERACFAEPWSRLSFTNEFKCTDSYLYGAVGRLRGEADLLAGYICFRLTLDEMHIFKIAVTPRWQRQGVASRLVDESITLAVKKGFFKAFLEVRQTNYPAVMFYQKNGFQIVATRKNYYSDTGEDALVMIKHLEVKL